MEYMILLVNTQKKASCPSTRTGYIPFEKDKWSALVAYSIGQWINQKQTVRILIAQEND